MHATQVLFLRVFVYDIILSVPHNQSIIEHQFHSEEVTFYLFFYNGILSGA